MLLKVGFPSLFVCCIGCVFVPTPEYALDKPDIRCAVGHAESSTPIRPGSTKRAQVLNILGAPQTKSSDDSTWYYARLMGIHYAIVLPPFYPAAGPMMQRPYYLRLDFGDDGMVVSFELRRGSKSDAGFGYALIGPSTAADAEFERAEFVSGGSILP